MPEGLFDSFVVNPIMALNDIRQGMRTGRFPENGFFGRGPGPDEQTAGFLKESLRQGAPVSEMPRDTSGLVPNLLVRAHLLSPTVRASQRTQLLEDEAIRARRRQDMTDRLQIMSAFGTLAQHAPGSTVSKIWDAMIGANPEEATGMGLRAGLFEGFKSPEDVAQEREGRMQEYQIGSLEERKRSDQAREEEKSRMDQFMIEDRAARTSIYGSLAETKAEQAQSKMERDKEKETTKGEETERKKWVDVGKVWATDPIGGSEGLQMAQELMAYRGFSELPNAISAVLRKHPQFAERMDPELLKEMGVSLPKAPEGPKFSDYLPGWLGGKPAEAESRPTRKLVIPEVPK